jgi:Spy/CpxP family protein refolding chaperone
MKSAMMFLTLMVIFGLILWPAAGIAQQPGGSGYGSGGGYPGWYNPYGQYMGPGMMGPGYGYMGPGMMGPGWYGGWGGRMMGPWYGGHMMGYGPWGGGPGYGWAQPPASNLTPEQSQKLFQLRKKYREDTEPLREQLSTKRHELYGLYAQEKPNQEAIDKLQKETCGLWQKLQEKRFAFRKEARDIAPELQGIGHGPGWGWHHRGPGWGGHMMGPYSGPHCWGY